MDSVGFNNTEAKRLVLQAGSYLVRAGCVSDLDFWLICRPNTAGWFAPLWHLRRDPVFFSLFPPSLIPPLQSLSGSSKVVFGSARSGPEGKGNCLITSCVITLLRAEVLVG